MMIRDPNTEWEAEYWDEFIKEFGVAEYIKERYMRGGEDV